MSDHTTPLILKNRPLVYLIHGTWGRGAAFVVEGSELRKRISSELESRIGEEPEYQKFEWSGANTLKERVFWAKALREAVERELKASDPNRPIFLVAHSHGGSLVAIALKNSAAMQERVSGVVTMGTPFVEMHPSAFGRDAARFAYFIFMCFLSVLIATFLLIVQMLHTAPTIGPILVAILIVATLHTLDRRLHIVRKTLVKLWRQRKVMDTARFKSRKLLVVSTPGDEAGFVLKFASYLIRVCQILARASAYIGVVLPTGSVENRRLGPMRIAAVFSYRCIAYAFCLFAVYVYILFGPQLFDMEQLRDAFSGGSCVVKPGLDDISSGINGAACAVVDGIRAALRFAVLAMPGMLLAAVFLIAPLAGGLIYRIVGWFGPLHVVFSRILITVLPLQGGDFLRLPNRPRRFMSGLRHSEVYLDAATVQKIAIWISASCNERRFSKASVF